VHFGGRSSTGELLTYFCYIMFTIFFSLQENYKKVVVKKYGEGFNYEEEPIDGLAIYDSGGGKGHGR
jgi:hypothetical protein